MFIHNNNNLNLLICRECKFIMFAYIALVCETVFHNCSNRFCSERVATTCMAEEGIPRCSTTDKYVILIYLYLALCTLIIVDVELAVRSSSSMDRPITQKSGNSLGGKLLVAYLYQMN